jgi:protein gp37
MAIESKIEWTNATWNPWYGCKKVSPGCKFCYAERDMNRYGKDFRAVTRSTTKFNAPKFWKEGKLVFTCSWSDWFIEEADAWRNDAWKVIRDTPQHTYQILTKRPERILDHLPEDWGDGYPNVWLGVSVESQAQVERLLVLSKVPAVVRFASFEPLIGPIDLLYPEDLNPVKMCCNGWQCGCMGKPVTPPLLICGDYLRALIDWAIIGGESGNDTGKHKYRPMEIEWALNLAADLVEYKIPVFVKQLGTYQAKELGLTDRKGGNLAEMPEALQLREMPK